jgi:citrate lyase subunit beta/citryl-CoA lyase
MEDPHMTMDDRPRRSALYVPGNKERVLQKAATLPADVVILDLEDAVGPEGKQAARQRVCAAAESGAYAPRETVIRINAVGTEWHDADVAAVARSGADAVLVPKVESAATVRQVVEALERADAPDDFKVWVMVETPRAFLRAEEIASAPDRLATFVIGTNDLVNEINARDLPDRAPVIAALSIAVLAAKAAGLSILDGVFNAIGDHAGFAAEAKQGRDMGFDGKTVVHPAQIEPANRAFGPSEDEVAHARKIIAAYDAAVHAGEDVIVVDGRMVESLHVRNARRVLRSHELISELSRALTTPAT